MLTAWTSLMLENPTAYRKLVDEIRGAFKSAADITWAKVKDLEYLGAVSSETFRVCAPVPTNLCRVVPPEGASIDGRWVPGGVSYPVHCLIFGHLFLSSPDCASTVSADTALPPRRLRFRSPLGLQLTCQSTLASRCRSSQSGGLIRPMADSPATTDKHRSLSAMGLGAVLERTSLILNSACLSAICCGIST